MIYRQAPYLVRCGECQERTQQSCRRCLAPRCEAHLLTDDALCADCEATYLTRPPVVFEPSRSAVLLSAAATGMTVATLSGSLLACFLVALGSYLAAPLLASRKRTERRARDAFIGELRRPPATPRLPAATGAD